MKKFKELIQDINTNTHIDVDGAMKHRFNSNNKLIHHTEDGIRNFHRWFGNSKAVDTLGRPLIVYHGTNADFESFDPDKHGENTGPHLVPHSTFVFTDNPKVANTYTIANIYNHGDPEYKIGGNIKPVYIKTKKTLVVDAKGENWNYIRYQGDDVQTNDLFAEAKRKKFDSVKITNVVDSHKGVAPKATIFAVFDPTHIKSATGNFGNFSKESENISEDIDHPMIDVDGEMKHRHNSENQPIHHTDEGIKNFHRWFNNSKVVDEHGRPSVVYHGTQADIESFRQSENGSYGKGIYFTNQPWHASMYASYGSGSVLPTYLSLKNPYILDVQSHKTYQDSLNKREVFRLGGAKEKIQAMGHDGVIVKDMQHKEFVVYDPENIKSAIGNKGSFDVQNKNISEDFEMDHQSTEIITEEEAKKVKLNKPFRTPGAAKKFAVHVKNAQGNIVIVRFGDNSMEIKRDDPERRKSFRARHSCDTATDKTTPRYWSCRFWESGTSVSDLLE